MGWDQDFKASAEGIVDTVRAVVQGLTNNYRRVRYLASVARSRWFTDPQDTFEQISLSRAWDYESELERQRHRRVLEEVACLRGTANWGNALELGCHDGVFTLDLASRCTHVMACDISSDACARARLRCSPLSQVEVARLNVEIDTFPGKYDLIFAMDILNYVYGRDRMLGLCSKISAALERDGLLVITECRLAHYIQDGWFRSWVPVGGDIIVDLFASEPALRLVHREFHPDAGQDVGPHYMAHVIAMYEKNEEGGTIGR